MNRQHGTRKRYIRNTQNRSQTEKKRNRTLPPPTTTHPRSTTSAINIKCIWPPTSPTIKTLEKEVTKAKNNRPNAAKAVPPAQPNRNVTNQAKKPPSRAAVPGVLCLPVNVHPPRPYIPPLLHGRPWKPKKEKEKKDNKTRTVLVSPCSALQGKNGPSVSSLRC